MTSCARSCCWTPHSCARQRTCPCHWEEQRPQGLAGDSATHGDPTANTAIRNVMKGQN